MNDDLKKLSDALDKLSSEVASFEIKTLRQREDIQLLFLAINKINNEDLEELLPIKLVQRILINQALTDDGISQNRLLLLKQKINFKDRCYGDELNELVRREDWSEGKGVHYSSVEIKIAKLYEPKELLSTFGSIDEILVKMQNEDFELEESLRTFILQSDYSSVEPLIDGLFWRPKIVERYREVASEAISKNIKNENREDIAKWKEKARQLLLEAPTNRFAMYWLWDSLDLSDYDR